jgi:hypothetical protein
MTKFNTSNKTARDFEQKMTSASREELIRYASDKNIDIFVDKEKSSIELIRADIRVSLYVLLDLSSYDKTIALSELNALKEIV